MTRGPATFAVVTAANGAGERLDVFLSRALDLPRRYVQRLLERERVWLAGKPATKGRVLDIGDRLEILPFRHPSEGVPAAPELPLVVLADERGLVAIDKPAGMPTHALDYDERTSAVNAFLARYPEAAEVGDGGLQASLVHRLDTHTSGVLLFAREARAWREAREAFSSGRAEKHYLARVHGALRGEREVALQLAQRGDHVRVVESGGRLARTRLGAVERDGDTSLVAIELLTGVRHQIRATLAHLGHPIVGDRRYGSPVDRGRHLLHATLLRIPLRSGRFEARSAPAGI
jgi:23S rRNA pseudouridine1911/1915/1917 synthase